jgi:hypothetical protein
VDRLDLDDPAVDPGALQTRHEIVVVGLEASRESQTSNMWTSSSP